MVSQKTLYILRHAKAETGKAGQDDHDRELNARGLDAAHFMGKYFVRHGIKPDAVLCSTAERARQTWEQVAQAYRATPSVQYSDKLYLASANEILNLLSAASETVPRVMVVGHNPGLHQLCLKLAKAGEEELLDILAVKFPTCALATITLDVPWRDAPRSKGTLKAFVTPGMLASTEDD